MEYFITFLEGLISFISPCMLPMLPLYLSYFAGADRAMKTADEAIETADEAIETADEAIETADEAMETADGAMETVVEVKETVGAAKGSARALPGAIAFVLGFTVVFCTMGLFAGTVGRLLMQHQILVNGITGCIVIFLGLVFLDLLQLPFLKGIRMRWEITGIFSAFLFGMVFSVSLTPCIGAFLGSALMLASSVGGSGKGLLLLLIYSMGLGIPFVVSAVLIGQLQDTFTFIKRHYRVINFISGGFLILVGVMMATGQLNRLLALLSF